MRQSRRSVRFARRAVRKLAARRKLSRKEKKYVYRVILPETLVAADVIRSAVEMLRTFEVAVVDGCYLIKSAVPVKYLRMVATENADGTFSIT